MAWIESHQKLKEDPKVFELMIGLNCSKAEAIGRLHMFWWWCVDQAENGDLRKFNDNNLAIAVELNSDQGKSFVEAMINAGFLERSPYFRISNWWKFCEIFMKRRYEKKPEKWQTIQALYSTERLSEGNRKADETPLDSTYQTKPNQTKPLRKIKIFQPPLLDEVKIYFKENGFSESLAEKFFNSYSVANWHDSQGSPVKNWKQKAINVWFKDENKTPVKWKPPKGNIGE